MNNKEKKILKFLVLIFVIVLLLALVLFLNKDSIIRKGKFIAPPMDITAIKGMPENVDSIFTYQEVLIKDDYVVYLSATPQVKDNILTIYFTSSKKNNSLLKIKIFDKNGKVLAETGLIEPDSYIKELNINRKLEDKEAISIKVMSYEKETLYSNGSFKLNVFVNSVSIN